MNNTMEYKGYIGSVEFSEADQILYGKVQGIRSLISYEGTTVTELVEDFHSAVDDYLELCSAEGKTPEKAFKGSFNVRFKNPVLHKKAAVYAYNHSVSLNSVVEESVAEYLLKNIMKYGNAMRECLEYFLDTKILAEEQMSPLSPETAKAKLQQLAQIMELTGKSS